MPTSMRTWQRLLIRAGLMGSRSRTPLVAPACMMMTVQMKKALGLSWQQPPRSRQSREVSLPSTASQAHELWTGESHLATSSCLMVMDGTFPKEAVAPPYTRWCALSCSCTKVTWDCGGLHVSIVLLVLLLEEAIDSLRLHARSSPCSWHDQACVTITGAERSNTDDLMILDLPEASASDVTDSEDDSQSSDGDWVMHEPSSSTKEALDALPNGAHPRQKAKQAAKSDRKASAAKSAPEVKQTKKSALPKHDLVSSASKDTKRQKKNATRTLEANGDASGEPVLKPQKAAKESKRRKKAAEQEVFAPAEDYEDMLHDDAPLQGLKGSGKNRAKAKQQHVSEESDADEGYEWG